MAEIPVTLAKIVVQEAPNKVCFSPSGVFGSNNFQGKINAEFFVEKRAYPAPFVLSVNPNTNSAAETHPDEGNLVMVREVQATVQFDPQLAEAVGSWLITQAKLLRAQMTGQQPISPSLVVENQLKKT